MKLLFEKSVPGRGMDILPPLDVPDCPLEAGLAREKALRLEHAAYASFKKAYRAGIPCACGNDAGSSFCEFDDTASEMVTMVEKCDLTPAEALAIGTINSAKMLDVEDELGSITVGKKAHLAVFDENPLNDIHALESCFMTVKNGEILYTRA